MAKALRITNWSEHYESAESRRITNLNWVRTPNGHNSVGFCQLLRHPNGMAHFGAWNLILQVASKCTPRGTLAFGGKVSKPHTAATIADVTRGSEKVIEEALPRLMELGWIEEVELGALQIAGQALPTAGQATSRGEEMRGDEREGEATPTPFEELAERYGLKKSKGKDDLTSEWKAVFKGLRTETVEKILTEARPGILWPSEFKAHRAQRAI